MIRAYEEIVELIASGSSSAEVAEYQASSATRLRVADLIEREKLESLSEEEKSELDHYMQLEHLMGLAKARAQAHLS